MNIATGLLFEYHLKNHLIFYTSNYLILSKPLKCKWLIVFPDWLQLNLIILQVDINPLVVSILYFALEHIYFKYTGWNYV